MNPAPLPNLSLERLLLSAVEDLQPDDRVLDVGTGTGVWALLALRQGAQVSATDLPDIPMGQVADNAAANNLAIPELLSGDLFESVTGRHFDRILFNPPFHVGVAHSMAERAYLGGANGELLKRFLRELPDYLTPGGSACIVLPEFERKEYSSELSAYSVSVRAKQWIPLMGTVYCLELGGAS